MKDGEKGTLRLKVGLADMLKGGVIMDVTTPEIGRASCRERVLCSV